MRFRKGGSPAEKVNDFFQKGVDFLKKGVDFLEKDIARGASSASSASYFPI